MPKRNIYNHHPKQYVHASIHERQANALRNQTAKLVQVRKEMRDAKKALSLLLRLSESLFAEVGKLQILPSSNKEAVEKIIRLQRQISQLRRDA